VNALVFPVNVVEITLQRFLFGFCSQIKMIENRLLDTGDLLGRFGRALDVMSDIKEMIADRFFIGLLDPNTPIFIVLEAAAQLIEELSPQRPLAGGHAQAFEQLLRHWFGVRPELDQGRPGSRLPQGVVAGGNGCGCNNHIPSFAFHWGVWLKAILANSITSRSGISCHYEWYTGK
jgi:hypothetical protein